MGIEIVEARSDPQPCPAGEDLTVTCRVACTGGSVKSVAVAIPPLGDFALYDDGTHGDETAGDGTYSRRETIPFLAPRGKHELEPAKADLEEAPRLDPDLAAAKKALEEVNKLMAKTATPAQ